MKTYIIIAENRKIDRDGNTYHDVILLDMDGEVINSQVKVYGYGMHYLQTASDMINDHEGNNKTSYRNIRDKAVIIFRHGKETNIIK